MKCFSTFGLLLQVICAFVSNVYCVTPEEVRYHDANAALSREAAAASREILNAHRSRPAIEFDYVAYGAETLMIYSDHSKFEHKSVENLKEELIGAINKMKDETHKCLHAYIEVVQSIKGKIITGKRTKAEHYSTKTKELEHLTQELLKAKDQYLEICIPEAVVTSTSDIKNRILAVLDSEEMQSKIATAGTSQVFKTSEEFDKQINDFLKEMDENAADARERTKAYKRIINLGGNYSKSRTEYKKRILECNETVQGKFKEHLNIPLFHRLSMVHKFCATVSSPNCRAVFANVVAPSLELINTLIEKKESDAKALFDICVDGAVLETTHGIR